MHYDRDMKEQRKPIAIIACGAEKATEATEAHALYTGSMFRMNLAAALALVAGDLGRVFILSALHGLIAADTIVAPYDVKMGDPGSVDEFDIAAQLIPLVDPERISQEIYAFTPRAYFDRLEAAGRLIDASMTWVNEADAGIGFQRGTAGSVARSEA